MNKIPALFALLCVTALPMAAQTRILVAKSRVPVSIADDPYYGIAMPTACDGQGRSYIKLDKPGLRMESPLFRLSTKGVVEAEFDTTGTLLNRYAVRPNGGVTMMYPGRAGQVVDSFAPDGTRESSVQLQRPPTPFFPHQLAVFDSGEMLIAGFQYQPDYKASAAIYDRIGRPVKQVVLDGDAEIEHAIEVGGGKDTPLGQQHIEAVSKSVAITGDDGLVYLMRATSPAAVYAISAAGDVVRKIMVSAPTGTGLPDFGIRVVKNRLVVQFYRSCDSTVDSSSCRSSVTYAVFDATTGKRLAAYEADKEVSGLIACYLPDPDRFFTFSRPPDRHGLDIVEAAPK